MPGSRLDADHPENGVLIPCRNTNAGCSNDWSTWFIGSRTQWNVTADTYLGLDVLYQRLTTATTGSALNNSPYFDPSAEIRVQNGNMDNWSARFRVHKDFYP